VPQFRTSRRVAHSAADMFNLVADVERYPEFVPLCDRMVVRGRRMEGGQEIVTATMTVVYKVLRESFTSRIVLARDRQEIRVSYIDGPFKHLENVWLFRPVDTDSCEVGFRIAYEFRSRVLQSVMGKVFDKAFRKFADAFEARADQIYGRRREAPGRQTAVKAAAVKGSQSA
jgi:coenzyme Q-binding protein COQ10